MQESLRSIPLQLLIASFNGKRPKKTLKRNMNSDNVDEVQLLMQQALAKRDHAQVGSLMTQFLASKLQWRTHKGMQNVQFKDFNPVTEAIKNDDLKSVESLLVALKTAHASDPSTELYTQSKLNRRSTPRVRR